MEQDPRAPRAASIPTFGFIAWGFLPTLFTASHLVARSTEPGHLISAAFFLAWWIVAALLVRGVRRAIAPALTLVTMPCLAVLGLEIQRVAFIVREGGMEAAYGRGASVLLLLLYWVLEALLVFLPLTIIAFRLRRARADMRLRPPA